MDLQFGDARIQAEQLDLYTTRSPTAPPRAASRPQGNVVFLRGEERLSGEQLEMDLGTGQGTFENAIGYVAAGRVRGGEARSSASTPHTYRIDGGKFTSCAQPNPRWSFSASSATLEVDDKITAKNVRVPREAGAGVLHPVLRLPDRAGPALDGLPLPALRAAPAPAASTSAPASSGRWAAASTRRSTSTTSPSSGYGFGHEFRYALPSPSRGNFRTYVLPASRRTAPGSTTSTGPRCRCCPGKVRANLQVQRIERPDVPGAVPGQPRPAPRGATAASSTSACSARFGPHNVQLLADSRGHLLPRRATRSSSARSATCPLLTVSRLAAEASAARAWCSATTAARRTSSIGDQDGVDKYARYDVYPRLSRPLSLSFLQLTPEVQVRGTRYGASDADPSAGLDRAGRSTRKYFESQRGHAGAQLLARVRHAGQLLLRPLQARDRPRGHLDVPHGAVEEFDVHPEASTATTTSSDTNEVRYALVQRLYAKRPGAAAASWSPTSS